MFILNVFNVFFLLLSVVFIIELLIFCSIGRIVQ